MAEAPECVLVLRFSSAGDVILTTPAVAALRRAWPKTRIIYAIKEAYAGLVRHNPDVTLVVELKAGESLRHYAARLRALSPQAILDLHGKLRSRALRLSLGAERVVVWQTRGATESLLVRLSLRTFHASQTIAGRYHQAVEELVGRTLPPGPLRLWVGAKEQAEADRTLAGIGHSKPIIGMSPGARWQTKRWPVDRFGGLANRAMEAGYQVVVTGAPAERPILAAVEVMAPGVVALGDVPLAVLPAVVARCRAFVANDSAPLHLARALRVPTLGLFGSTDPSQFGFTGHTALRVDLPCSPCHFHGRSFCPRGHFRCMTTLDVETAWHALVALMRAGTPPELCA